MYNPLLDTFYKDAMAALEPWMFLLPTEVQFKNKCV